MYKITILGGGESGTGAALLGKQRGYEVFVSDAYTIGSNYKERLVAHGIPFEEGGHTMEAIHNTQEVIKSPGIPYTSKIIQTIGSYNIPVIDEIEFAARYAKGVMIAITGSNGKTTTAHLIYHLLKEANKKVALVGNVGSSFASCLTKQSYDHYVLELSSFQLEGIQKFKPHIACLLNITPDHLDRYDSMTPYIQAKFNLLRNMSASDHFVYNQDDPIIHDYLAASEIIPQLYPISAFPIQSRKLMFPPMAHSREAMYHFGRPHPPFAIEHDLMLLPGLHNQYNAMAAILAASLAGVSLATIKQALPQFHGLSHRLEWCGNPKGIHCYNDSKATNVASTMSALKSFAWPIVWIVGGQDKGNDYTQLIPIAKEKVRAIVCLGKDNKKIIEAFRDLSIPITETDQLAVALDEALVFAHGTGIILFSPACASFDLFKNYADRGNQFKERVRELMSQ